MLLIAYQSVLHNNDTRFSFQNDTQILFMQTKHILCRLLNSVQHSKERIITLCVYFMYIANVSVHPGVVDEAFSAVLARVRSRPGVGKLMIFKRLCRVEELSTQRTAMFAHILSVLDQMVMFQVRSGRLC